MKNYRLQLGDYDCGSTAVYNLFVYLNDEKSEADVLKDLDQNENGTSLLAIQQKLRSCGLRTEIHPFLSPFRLFKTVCSGFPVITMRLRLPFIKYQTHIELLIPSNNKNKIDIVNPHIYDEDNPIKSMGKFRFFFWALFREFLGVIVYKNV